MCHRHSRGHDLPHHSVDLPLVQARTSLFKEVFSEATVNKIRIALSRVQSTDLEHDIGWSGLFHAATSSASVATLGSQTLGVDTVPDAIELIQGQLVIFDLLSLGG